MDLVVLPPSRMVPLPELFRHPSDLHGQAHVARVMVHAMRLVDATGQHALGRQLWASVFLHDLARTHDGVCHRHGADAAQRLRGEPDLQQRLVEARLTEADYPAIEAAVTAHSAPKEVSRTHPHWPLIALSHGPVRSEPHAAGLRTIFRAFFRLGHPTGRNCFDAVRASMWQFLQQP